MNRKTLFFVLTLYFTLFFSCRKMDNQLERPLKEDKVHQFFSYTKDLPATIQRVIALLRQHETRFEFVDNFVKNQGFPLWKQAFIKVVASPSSRSTASSNEADTIIKIPLQLEGFNTIHGYLRCTVSSSTVTAAIIDGRQYEQYGFMNSIINEVTSESIVTEIMYFNYAIFGVNNFSLTDNRLFGNNTTNNVVKTAKFDSVQSLVSQNLHSRGTSCFGGRTTVFITTTSNHCPYSVGSCTGPGGSCDNCTEYCSTSSTEIYSFCSQETLPSSPQTIVWTLEQPGDPVGGGVVPLGWVPTMADPCVTTTSGIVSTTICGLGWISNVGTTPYLFKKSIFDIYSGDEDNNTSGNIDTTSYQPYQIGQPWDTISNVIDIVDFIGWGAPGVSRNCMAYAKAQIAKKGKKISNYYEFGQTIQLYTSLNGADSNAVKDGIGYLMSALNRGIPVIVGVDDKAGSSNPKTDKTTDHFIVIVGMGCDVNGNYFTFYDNASGDPAQGANINNKLYFDPVSWQISGLSYTDYFNESASYNYIVTMIRKSK